MAKLLDLAGMRSGHLELHIRPLDLACVVNDAVEAVGDTTDRIAIEVNMPASVHMDGDPQRLRQVVDELLSKRSPGRLTAPPSR